jgi:hypothetical protein
VLLDRDVPVDRDRLVKEYAAWMPHLSTRADLTLRCRATMRASTDTGRRISLALNDDLLRATIVRALNRLNGYVLGSRGSKQRARLDALVWVERGALTGRPHAHALIERPVLVGAVQFASMIVRAWQAQPFGYKEVHVEEVRDLESCIRYNAKTSRAISGTLVYFHKESNESAWWRMSQRSENSAVSIKGHLAGRPFESTPLRSHDLACNGN